MHRSPEIVEHYNNRCYHCIKDCVCLSWCPSNTCDNGPQYTSYEMKEFAESYGFTHTTSSPHYPQANGQAERAVKTANSLLEHAPDPYLALLSYRATLLPWCKRSPAELLMGRCLRTDLPQVKDHYIPDWSYLSSEKVMASTERLRNVIMTDVTELRSYRCSQISLLYWSNKTDHKFQVK